MNFKHHNMENHDQSNQPQTITLFEADKWGVKAPELSHMRVKGIKHFIQLSSFEWSLGRSALHHTAQSQLGDANRFVSYVQVSFEERDTVRSSLIKIYMDDKPNKIAKIATVGFENNKFLPMSIFTFHKVVLLSIKAKNQFCHCQFSFTRFDLKSIVYKNGRAKGTHVKYKGSKNPPLMANSF